LTAVRVSEVRKRYGSVRALDEVSFELNAGITGLLGPNGAGKTTLLRCLATVLVPDSGSIEVFGYDPARPPERTEIRRRLGYMPQEPGFYRSFTCFDFLDYLAILKEHVDRPARHEEVRTALARTGLQDKSTVKIRKLSGGMRRRLALAQSLIGSPPLLVLDEPTAGLDPEQRFRFRELISDLAGSRTVLLSTHQTEDVSPYANGCS
jgi:ABC-2 type transport system ATP-binding protein